MLSSSQVRGACVIHYDESKLRRGFSLKKGRCRFRLTARNRWSLLLLLSMQLHFLWLLLGSLAFVATSASRPVLLLVAACAFVLGTLLTFLSAPRMTRYQVHIDLPAGTFQVRTKGRLCPPEAVHMEIIPRGYLGQSIGLWIRSSKDGRPVGPVFLAASKDGATIRTLMDDLQLALDRA
jgi:hypothetical protein